MMHDCLPWMKEPPSDYHVPQQKETNLNSKSAYSQHFTDKAIFFYNNFVQQELLHG